MVIGNNCGGMVGCAVVGFVGRDSVRGVVGIICVAAPAVLHRVPTAF